MEQRRLTRACSDRSYAGRSRCNELISCADRDLQEIWELREKLIKKTYNTG